MARRNTSHFSVLKLYVHHTECDRSNTAQVLAGRFTLERSVLFPFTWRHTRMWYIYIMLSSWQFPRSGSTHSRLAMFKIKFNNRKLPSLYFDDVYFKVWLLRPHSKRFKWHGQPKQSSNVMKAKKKRSLTARLVFLKFYLTIRWIWTRCYLNTLTWTGEILRTGTVINTGYQSWAENMMTRCRCILWRQFFTSLSG